LDCLEQRLQGSNTRIIGADIVEWVEVGSAMDLCSVHVFEVGAQEEGHGFGHFTDGESCCHRVTCEEEAVAALAKMLAHRQISMASVEQLETYQVHLKIMDKQIDYARRKEQLAKTIAPPIEIQDIAKNIGNDNHGEPGRCQCTLVQRVDRHGMDRRHYLAQRRQH
jgi:hypothetical protein